MREWAIGELLSQSLDDFKKNMGTWIAFTFAIFVVSLSISMASPDGGSVILSLISFLINTFIGLIFVRMGLAAAKGGDIDTQGLFANLHLFLPYLILSILTSVAVGLGMILLIIPGIYLALAFSVAQYALVDKELKCFPALKASMDLTNGHKWHILGFMIVLIAINLVGAILFLIGLLVTIPLSVLAASHLYLILSGAEEMVDVEETVEEVPVEEAPQIEE